MSFLPLAALLMTSTAWALPTGDELSVVATLQREASALRDFVHSDVARDFLAATGHLAPAQERTLYREPDGRWLSARQAERLSPGSRDRLTEKAFEPTTYYTTKYGSPLANCRALDLLGQAGLETLEGRRLLDFGYGTVGHLRLMASLGADVTGVDVDAFLAALYSEAGDQGPVDNPAGEDGSLSLVHGRWPAEEATLADVGTGYDIFLSKNTLKRGYIHPERETDPRRLIDLGVDDETYLFELHRILVPGGLALIYNLCPPQAAPEEPYIPWADGRSPFSAEQWTEAGFEVLAFDIDDSASARQLGQRLGWGTDGDLETGLFAHYTLVRKQVEG